MSKYVSLMYHAIYGSCEELAAIPPHERPYALAVDKFRHQLETISRLGLNVIADPTAASGSNKPAVLITFDDGDSGWFKYALPALAEYGYPATFFVTTDLVDEREDFCSWEQIQELANSGMRVQSHGKSHLFLSDLPKDKLGEEFSESKSRLESITGQKVDSISFPGGRYSSSTLAAGREREFDWFYTSEIGVNAPSRKLVRRVAIRADTSPEEFERIINRDKTYFFKTKILSKIKSMMKLMLGNSLYHRVYKIVKG